MRSGLSSELPEDALAVIFEQAWEDNARGCGSFTMRLLVAEVYRLRRLLRESPNPPRHCRDCANVAVSNGRKLCSVLIGRNGECQPIEPDFGCNRFEAKR
jgi:hypothetical protein